MPKSAADLRDLVRAAERVAADANFDDIAARLREGRAERDRPGTRVAVVGDFNRGKSTLINRLVDVDLLPTGNVPLTKVAVVVRAAKDGPASLEVSWPDGRTERRWLIEPDAWRGLVLDGAKEAIEVGEGQAGPEEPELLLSVPAPWLAGLEIELIDTPGLHEGRIDHMLHTKRAVALSDVVVVTISAPSPLSLLERDFLADELLTKRVPHIIVVLTKADQLPESEIADFYDWFRSSVTGISPSLQVMLGPGLVPGGEVELTALRDRISDLAHAADAIRRRDQRLEWHLAEACTMIRSAAQAAIDQLELGEESRQEKIQETKQQLDDDGQRWNRLRLGLDEKRLRCIDALTDSVMAATSELFETLDLELSRVGDVKAWWEKELPVRLRRELKNLTHLLEGQVSRSLSADFSWLAREVVADFGIDQRPAITRRRSSAEVGDLPDLDLDDLRRRRMIMRIVSATGGIIGTASAFVCGVGMPVTFTIGGSAIAGIVAERNSETKTEEQRAKVREHLHLVIDDVLVQYQAKLAAEVNHCYQKALEDLRGAQESWRTACFEAIASTGDGGQDMTAWMAIQRRADEIRGRIPADCDDFDHDHVKETFA